MSLIQFENPANGYIENYNTKTSWIWCLLFGPFYWLARGNIFHAFISLGLVFVTFCVSHFIYPFFANSINIKTYGKNGWKRKDVNTMLSISTDITTLSQNSQSKVSEFNKYGFPKQKRWRDLSLTQKILILAICIPLGLWVANKIVSSNKSTESYLYKTFN
ncbi:MAG: hypothetical protein J0L77_00245 [Alphaproteobacteria bacterium]|nr:hypothetical protein [Alphaproteobacteria bacterium]